MADIKQINLAGTTYNLVDDTAVHSVSATSTLATGITTGTITVDGVTTTFYAPDGSKDYYIEASTASLDPTSPPLLNIVTLTNGDTISDLLTRYTNGETLYIRLTAQDTSKSYILNLIQATSTSLLFGSYLEQEDLVILKQDYEMTISIYSLSSNTRAQLEFKSIDTKVEQIPNNSSTYTLPVMLGHSGVTTAITAPLYKTDSLVYNPSTKLLQAGALGITSGIGYTTTLPTTTTGFENGQIMFVVFEET